MATREVTEEEEADLMATALVEDQEVDSGVDTLGVIEEVIDQWVMVTMTTTGLGVEEADLEEVSWYSDDTLQPIYSRWRCLLHIV